MSYLFRKGELAVRRNPDSVISRELVAKGFSMTPYMVWELFFDPALQPYPQRIRLARMNEKAGALEVWHNSKGVWLPTEPGPEEGWFLARYFVPYSPKGGGD